MGQRASNTSGVTFEDVVIPNKVSPVILFSYLQSPLPEYSRCTR